jgi:hypothetical protein
MPPARLATLIAVVLAAAGVTVLAAATFGPGLGAGAASWTGVVLLAAAAVARLAWRRR